MQGEIDMKLFVSDLDKTLLNSQHQIGEQNMIGLRMLSEIGYNLCIASGRAYSDILRIMQSLEIDISIIALNGALIFDNKGQIIASNPLKDKETIKRIIEYCEEKALIYHLYCSDTVYSRKYSNMMEQLYTLSSSKYTDIQKIIQSMQLYYNAFYQNKILSNFNDAMAILNKNNIFKLEIFSENKQLLDDISLMITDDLNYSSSSPRNIEITNQGINKGDALIQLCDYLNINLSDVIAIGDNFNDYEMLQVAGKSIAMSNAEEQIKKIANHITLNADDAGVHYAINNYLRKEL